MGDRQKRLDGGEGFHLPVSGRVLPSAEAEIAPAVTTDPSDAEYTELIEHERLKLLKIAAEEIEQSCQDRYNHAEDIVQQANLKVLRGARERETGYTDIAKLLRIAVRQEASRHRLICRREEAVDFGKLSGSWEESDASDNGSYSPGRLVRETFKDPTEIYNGLLDLDELLAGVTDKDLFVRYYVEGLTLEEISDLRGCALMTVQRAKEKLKGELGIPDEKKPRHRAPNNKHSKHAHSVGVLVKRVKELIKVGRRRS